MNDGGVLTTLIVLLAVIFYLMIRLRYYKREYHHICISFNYARKFIDSIGKDHDWQKYIDRIGEEEDG